jgi:hypothetical protein
MKIKTYKTVKQEVEIEVDDRIYGPDTSDARNTWMIANIILNGCLPKMVDSLYGQEYNDIIFVCDKINEAFQKADKILEIMK